MSNQTNIEYPAGTWDIDPAHSSVSFSVRHLMISKVKGEFGAFTGTIVTTGNPEETTVDATIDVTSISTKESGRDAHLNSVDFFDSEHFPNITFVSSSLESTGKEDKYILRGDLTIRGTTKPVVLDFEFGGIVVDGYGQTKAAASAETKISRGDFGLTWNSTLETGGVVVSDEVSIQLDIQAVLR